MRDFRVGFIGFGEINTPVEVINRKCRDAEALLRLMGYNTIGVTPVRDDENYHEADDAISTLRAAGIDMLVVCIAGWIPTHAIIRCTDKFRHIPFLVWGLCGWYEDGRLISTADQAGASGLRYAMQELGYRFKYVYSVVNKDAPTDEIKSFIESAKAAAALREARIGSMGYRDMLLYGTMFDGLSLCRELGVEVEPFEMLEIYQKVQTLEKKEIDKGVRYVRENFRFTSPCLDEPIKQAVSYALAIGNKIQKRRYEAVTLNDVDGMKKLLGIPPALVLMLLDRWFGVCTIPENDIMGSATQLMCRFATSQIAAYVEWYEFFGETLLAGVPDFIPAEVTMGESVIKSSVFGQLGTSLLNVSKFRDGRVTLCRLASVGGAYKLHMFTGEAKQPEKWEECGWEPPAPQLPSLEIKPDCGVREFARKVSSQHMIITYGDNTAVLKDLCNLLKIEVV